MTRTEPSESDQLKKERCAELTCRFSHAGVGARAACILSPNTGHIHNLNVIQEGTVAAGLLGLPDILEGTPSSLHHIIMKACCEMEHTLLLLHKW
jgi:hypothetical protein